MTTTDHDDADLEETGPSPVAETVTRPLAVTGIVAAVWAAGIGLTVLTTITLLGWIAAPRGALGTGLPGVFRTAVGFWLMAHHAGFTVPRGRVGLLPLGLMILPGALLFRAGGWIARTGRVRGRYRIGVTHAAFALAIPYAVLSGLLALVASSSAIRPSAWQALLLCFLLAMFAGGLGAARTLVSTTNRAPWVAMLGLLPRRARSVAAGVTGATVVLLGFGVLIFLASLLFHLSEAENLYDVLKPGVVGGILVVLIGLVYLPNAALWAVAYAVGPGFAVGAGTSVSPSGVFVGMIPAFPPFAALPEPGPAPAVSLLALAVPFVAGAVGGVFTIRYQPTEATEAAPLWGFVSGVATGGVIAFLAALSGGPLGGGRMAVMGPSAWQTGLLAALEVGVSAAIAAWIANWRLSRRLRSRPEPLDDEEPDTEELEFEDPDPVLATVDEPLPEGVIPIGEWTGSRTGLRPRGQDGPGGAAPIRRRPPRDRG
ncbi:cell division protein PerM [Actinoallomurus rhizosphaericola]|uniref:cell division protein PerM n=1 Tax=Actinoallomurus rhizosphaericola TaxID=2952536 RepID=UPI0020924C1C|nr:DUF6350 family protein [Actinoallomurus rhizosphaericola]MCO5999189.1 DUF6350 family protein [Actinoallomurus rhizosphaericola]